MSLQVINWLQGLPGSGDTLYFVLEESEGEDGRVKGNCTVAIKEADPEEETGLVGEYGSPVEDVCEVEKRIWSFDKQRQEMSLKRYFKKHK